MRRVQVVVAAVLLSLGAVLTGSLPSTAASAGSDPNAPSGQCAESTLRVSVQYDPEATGAGQRLSYIGFQNHGAHSCVLHGAPGVSLVGHGNGTQLGRPAARTQHGTAPTVLLRPGQTARAALQYSAIDAGGGAYGALCRAVRADGYRVYPPHSFRSVYVHAPQYACTNPTILWGSVSYLRATPGGCAATHDAIPARAVQHQVADVDGDGRPDIEWAELEEGGTVHFGITTASGATVSARQQFAGGGDRSAVIGRLADGHVIALVSEGRDSSLDTFMACHLRQVHGIYDRTVTRKPNEPFFFYSVYSGGAAGCINGHLDGFETRPIATGRVKITARTVTLTRDGLHATTGAPTVLIPSTPDRTTTDSRRLSRYSGISCTPSKTLHPTFHSS